MAGDELKAMLARLVEGFEAERAGNIRFREDVRAEFRLLHSRLNGFEKRLDDQGRILAALIPTRLAAVPAAMSQERQAS
jgi:hypothetical protein